MSLEPKYENGTKGTKGLLLILKCSNKPDVAAADAKALKGFFSERQNIVLERECKHRDELETYLKEAKDMLKTNTQIYCFICAILGNGHKGFVDLAGNEYPIENIRKAFRNYEKDPYFIGRPKVFLIQAGQGKNLQKASFKFVDGEMVFHVDADALVAYANTPDYAAFESDKGSYFIQTCIQVFECTHKTCHLEEMMVIVKEQMSCYRFRPTKQPNDPVEKKDDVPVEKQTDVPVEKQADVPVEKQDDVRCEKQAAVTVEKQADDPVEKQAAVPVEKQADDETFTQIPCVWTTLTRFLYFKSPNSVE